MASRHDIIHIDFEANAGKASPALKALRDAAKDTSEQITNVTKTLEDLKSSGAAAAEIAKTEKELKNLNRDLKSFTQGEKELVKGLDMLSKGIEAFNNGTLEKMSAAFNKAVFNAAKLNASKINPDTAEGRQHIEELNALMLAAEKNVLAAQRDFEQLTNTISSGGRVSVTELRQAETALKELSDLTAHGSDEWKKYNAQLTAVSGKINSITETERRLAGEIVTVADAMKTVSRTSAEMASAEAAAAKAEMEKQASIRSISQTQAEAAQQRLEMAEKELAPIDEELKKQRELADVLKQSVEIRHRLAEAKDERNAARRGTFEEKGKWLNLNDDVVKATVNLDELKEKRANTSNLKEQLKLREEITKAEKELADAQSKAAEQDKEVTKAREKLAEADKKVKKIEEELSKFLDGRDYDEEIEKLDKLETQHDELTESIKKERQAYAENAAAAKEAADKETQAAIDMAQAQSYSRKSLEDSIAVLERQNKVETDPVKYEQQAQAIEKMRTRLKEMTGEWMSFAEAEKLAGKIGTDGFVVTQQTIQKVTQAYERRRDALINTIQQQKLAGKATAAEEAELEKLEEQLKDLKFEQDNFNMSRKQMDALLDNPRKATDLDELKEAVKRADGELRRMKQSLGENNEKYQEFAKRVKNAKNELKEMEGQSKATGSAFDKAWSRLKTYITLYMGAAVAIQKLTSVMGDLMDLSDKMGEVRKTTGFTADEVGRLSRNLAKMDTRTTLTGLMDLSVAAGQLGLKTEQDVIGFTEAANKLMVALPEMGKEGATEMLKVALATGEIAKIQREMDEGTIKGSSATAVAMEKVGSTIDRLRATSAATAPAITDFVKRVGAVGAQSGITIDQVAALGSTVDALGMRVEMSATALSRMMPAIRNNAFDIAKILGVTPNSIRELYDAGKGMDVILMILQHMKDAGLDADSIESMLGMGGMKEIMKELNQQGARAGIVFGGLSQNVDELRRQLGVAKQAYKENIAIQQEYDKMNETTAAKWERLKNQMEEAFVGDWAQKVLGGIIDALRWFVDFLTGNVGPALRFVSGLVKTFIVYLAVLKAGLGEGIFIKAAEGIRNMGSNLKNLISNTRQYIIYSRMLSKAQTEQARTAIEAEMAQKGLNKAMIANVWVAVIAAVITLGAVMWNWVDSLKEAGREAAKFQAELDKEQKKVDELANSIGEARVKMEEASGEVEKARVALEAAKKANDGTTESVKRLSKAEADLLEKEEKKKNAMAEHKQLIEQFNTQYGKYLGFMLSEVSSNLELARARELVNDKLRETITLKRQEAALERVEKDKGAGRDKQYGNLYTLVGSFTQGRDADPTKRARVMAAITKAANTAKDKATFRAQVEKILRDNKISTASGVVGQAVDYFDEVQSVRQATEQVVEQFRGEQAANRQISQGSLVRQANAGMANYNKLLKDYRSSKGDARARNAAAVLQQMDTMSEIRANAGSYYDMNDPKEAALYKKQFGKLNAWTGFDRNALLKEAGKYYTPRKTMEGAGGSGFTPSKNLTGGLAGASIWGDEVSAESTDYATWNVNELVARRNQMNTFKNVLKPGIDVRKVLAEDKALMKAIDEGKVGEDWQSVLDWYNAERKKIQQELKSERFSTNEGNWRDEQTKKGRRRVNPLVESDYALAELDRYYSRRKEALEKARSEENISEELYSRQAEMLEQEHLERRSKLRATFTGEVGKEEIASFRKWWAELEKQDELDHVPWATVESEWSKALAAQIGRNNLRMQQDMTQVESITMKHVNQIAKIVAKERPYDGITENLQANLTKLDILFADLGTVTKQQLEDGSLTKELSRRLSFLLGEAEHAYSLSTSQLMADMGREGFQAWADAIANAENAEDLKHQLLAQLQIAYDAVQDAIKKESNQIKRQAEILWNDTILPNGQSQKQAFESTLSVLGLLEDQVKRNNTLIDAGYASERVADKLAIKQMKVRLAMQEQYFNLIRKIGEERIAQLEAAGKKEDAEHLRKSLDLSLSEEQKKLDEQRVDIQNQLEESQNRLYKQLKEWADLMASSLQSLFEASHTGEPEYFNERAKLNLTGKGGPGAGTYVVIDNAGKSSATAHYEYLDERGALERQLEIERQNAMSDAWKKVMDDINMKMSETITDWINATLQNSAVDLNTAAVDQNTSAEAANTEAVIRLTDAILGKSTSEGAGAYGGVTPAAPAEGGAQNPATQALSPGEVQDWVEALGDNPMDLWMEASDAARQRTLENNKKAVKSTQSSFAAMTAAANMYGIAYQAMANENLSTAQKVEMMIVQAAGQAAISMLTASMAASTGETAANAPAWVSKTLKELGPIGGPVAVGVFTALIGGLMGMAMSKISKSKSEIAQATGASSVNAGRLTTGMLAYAEGNVNEFTDPSTLREGRQYNVDASDGRTYRARYMGRHPRTHLTNGPEFHLSGESGREMIIDAGTTRRITMNEAGIWRAIQTLSAGGRIRRIARRGRGVSAFAEGNVEDFEDMAAAAVGTGEGFDPAELRASLDRNSAVQEALLERLKVPLKAVVSPHGPDGIVAGYDKAKKEAMRHGEKY